MAINPKLEFFLLGLKPKGKRTHPVTFRDFATDNLQAGKSPTDEKVMNALFSHFMKELKGGNAVDNVTKKAIRFEKKKSANSHTDKAPSVDLDNKVIHGVISGGMFGRDRFLSNNDDEEDTVRIGLNRTVNGYFYFFAFLPPDHHEGFVMIHSNSREESVASHLKTFFSKIFSGKTTNYGNIDDYAPTKFQKEWEEESLLKGLVFRRDFSPGLIMGDGSEPDATGFKIRIEAVPLFKEMPRGAAESLMKQLGSLIFGKGQDAVQLNDFQKQMVLAEGATGTQKTFEWNLRDETFVPVVYLEGRINNRYADDTPDLVELREYCFDLFLKDILPDLRQRADVA